MAFNEWILAHEPGVRLSAFFGMFALMGTWEARAPRRARALTRRARWPHNLALVALNSLILRFAFPLAALGTALLAAERGWGLLNAYAVPFPWAFVLALLALDCAIYLQHVLFHAVPALWRLHRMHHADLDFDVTTGARFHPLEIVISMGIKLAVVSALGAPALAVLVFEILLNATAMFNHSNVNIPVKLDCLLRLLVVTPDMHRVHHSVRPAETNSNFGFNLPWWDRLFGTYAAQPRDGHADLVIGIEQFRAAREQRLDRMLIQPFVGGAGSYAINRSAQTDHGD